MKKWMILMLVCSVFFIGFSATAFASEKKLKAGFIYVGPVGDYGWSHAHDLGRKYAEQKFPWLETVIVESVAESDSSRIIDRLIQPLKYRANSFYSANALGNFVADISRLQIWEYKRISRCLGFYIWRFLF